MSIASTTSRTPRPRMVSFKPFSALTPPMQIKSASCARKLATSPFSGPSVRNARLLWVFPCHMHPRIAAGAGWQISAGKPAVFAIGLLRIVQTDLQPLNQPILVPEPESGNRWGRRASSRYNRCESPEYRAGHGRDCAGGRSKADARALFPAYCDTRFFGCALRSSPVLRDSRRVLGEASDAPAYPNTRHGAAPMSRAAVPVFGEMAIEAKGRPCSHAPAQISLFVTDPFDPCIQAHAVSVGAAEIAAVLVGIRIKA